VPYVYVLTNPAMPGLVKIGRTEDDSKRISQLYTTAVPFPFNLEFACRVTDHNEVENALHIAFAPYRVNPRRKFFKIEPAQAIAILKLLHTEDATAEVAAEVAAEFNAEPTGEKQKDMELGSRAGEHYRRKRPNMNFREMNILPGSILTSLATGQEVTVTGDKKVKLGNEEMFLSPATKKVLKLGYDVAPGPYWTYQGRLLRDIYDETYPAGE
jgi:T5orf172 domain